MEIISFEQKIIWLSRRCRNFLIFIFRKYRNMCPYLYIDSFLVFFPNEAIFFLIQCILYFIDGDKCLVIVFILFFQSVQERQHMLPLFLR